MTVASGVVTRDVLMMPGGQRVLGHALEFGRDPLALFQRAREHGMWFASGSGRSAFTY